MGEVCRICGEPAVDEHHTSYEPEETIHLCKKCHGKVHNKDGFHDDQLPEGQRPQEDGAEAVRVGCTIPEYQANFIDDMALSPSSILQDELDERIERYGWERGGRD